MKKVQGVLVCLVVSCAMMYGQSWVSSNRIYSDTDVSAIQTTSGPDGRIVLLGDFTGTVNVGATIQLTSNGSRDYFVAKFTETGEVDWARKLGGSALEYAKGGICACFDNNIFVTGGFRNDLFYTDVGSIPSAGGWDTFLAKYDPDGNVLWCNNIGSGALNQRPNSLKVDKSGNVLIGGFFSDSIYFDETTTLYSDDGIDDYFYSKFDTDGNLLWAKQIKSIENIISGRIFAIDATENHYYFSGFFADSTIFPNDTIVSLNNSYDIHIIATSLDGDVEWIRKIAGKGDDLSYGIVVDESDNVYLSGYYDTTDTLFVDESGTDTLFLVDQNNGDFDFLVAKYNVDGNLQWIRTAGGEESDKLNDISLAGDSVIVSGYFSDTLMWGGIEVASSGAGDVDMFVGRLDSEGNFRTG
jgi:hypothetical protein